MKKMRVIMLEPGKTAYVTEIDGSLEGMQKAVGGWIEALYPFDDEVAIVCNEEGKLNGMSANRALRDEDGDVYDVLFGPCFICGLGRSNFKGIPDKYVEKYTNMFKEPISVIGKVGNRVVVI